MDTKHTHIMKRWRTFREHEKGTITEAIGSTNLPKSVFPMYNATAAALNAFGKGITTPVGAEQTRIAQIDDSGKNRGDEFDSENKTNFRGGLASFSLTATPLFIADGERCFDAADQGMRALFAEIVLWNLDTGDSIRGIEPGFTRFFFEEKESYHKLINLLHKAVSAAKQGKGAKMGLVGEVPCRMLGAEVEDVSDYYIKVPKDKISATKSQIMVGVTNIATYDQKELVPSVVVIFGELPPGKLFLNPPYFFSVEGAAKFSDELKKTGTAAASKIGGFYVHPLPDDLGLPAEIDLKNLKGICKSANPPKKPTTEKPPANPSTPSPFGSDAFKMPKGL